MKKMDQQPGNYYWRGTLSAVDPRVLTSLDQLVFISKMMLITFVTKQVTLMRKSTVLSLPLLLVFPATTNPFVPTLNCWFRINNLGVINRKEVTQISFNLSFLFLFLFFLRLIFFILLFLLLFLFLFLSLCHSFSQHCSIFFLYLFSFFFLLLLLSLFFPLAP